MNHPVKALQMAQDLVLPNWLRSFADVMSNTYPEESGRLLAPETRKIVEGWLLKPADARAFVEYGELNGSPKFLVQVAKVLGLRRRYKMPDKKFFENE